MSSNLNYKLLKIGAIASSDYNDQIFEDGCWRDLNNNKHFKVGQYFKIRRPADKKSLEIIRILQEELVRLDLVRNNIMELIYK